MYLFDYGQLNIHLVRMFNTVEGERVCVLSVYVRGLCAHFYATFSVNISKK